MSTGAVQTIWAELLATTLADAGVARVVISPGSRSTPLVAALAGEPRLALTTLIDERAAGFFALGAARATGQVVALVCTSGTAAAHYLPAIIEASLADVPLLVITADRPPELYDCGASQTIDQIKLYGGFVRGAIDLGAPTDGELALRALRRKLVQAITLAIGPAPGPVHLEVPLRKPLEPAAPGSEAEQALACAAAAIAGPVTIHAPVMTPADTAIEGLARAIAAEPDGAIVVGAMPARFAAIRDAVLGFAARIGYPVIAEAGSQLRFGPRPDGACVVDHFDLIPAAQLPVPRLAIQLGAEPVAASWPAWAARLPERWVIAGPRWHDSDSAARGVILGSPSLVLTRLGRAIGMMLEAPRPAATGSAATWRALDAAAGRATAAALDAHPTSEVAVLHAALGALPAGAALQIGNSMPIRVVDYLPPRAAATAVHTQRGAAGIDGLIASAAGATTAGAPVLLVLGDVSFAHDLGGLLAARAATAPLTILVIDNRGGQIFAGLPFGKAAATPAQRAAFERHWTTVPDVDPVAVAAALGHRATLAATPAAVAAAITAAFSTSGTSLIHAPVSPSGAHSVRSAALAGFDAHRGGST
ncbi:MAG TPA: 2-succinyl-5-enolpyruvyl-6-hydroxy-3-cyclohexene-1-carboxylic-acid synthase [Kofleriaceae bacterium]